MNSIRDLLEDLCFALDEAVTPEQFKAYKSHRAQGKSPAASREAAKGGAAPRGPQGAHAWVQQGQQFAKQHQRTQRKLAKSKPGEKMVFGKWVKTGGKK